MRKKLKQTITTSLLAASLVFSLTACGGEQGAGTKETAGKQETTANKPTATPEGSQEGALSSSAWSEGLLEINGKSFTITQTTLEQFAESGYTADEADMNYVLHGRDYFDFYDEDSISLHDGKHQNIAVWPYNYSKDKPLYAKHALLAGYSINLSTGNGLEGADVVLPGNIKGGMTREDVKAIVGIDFEDSYGSNLYYPFKKNDETLYSVEFSFDDTTESLSNVTYKNYQEYANAADDSAEISEALEKNKETSLTKKSAPSKVLKDAEIKIGKKVYRLPIYATDLTKLGYTVSDYDKDDLSGNLSKIFNPKEYHDYYRELYDKGDNTLYVEGFYNPSNSPRALSDCLISTIKFDKEAENVSIAKGIKVGSTYKEVCKAFGKKKKDKDDDTYDTHYSYSAKRGKVSIRFTFNNSTDKVTYISIGVTAQNYSDDD